MFDELGFLFSRWVSFRIKLDQDQLEFISESHEPDNGFDYLIALEARVMKSCDNARPVGIANMMTWKDILERNRQLVLL